MAGEESFTKKQCTLWRRKEEVAISLENMVCIFSIDWDFVQEVAAASL